MEKDLCSKFNGKSNANFCTINNGSQEVKVSIWTPFTKNKPEKHMNEDDIRNVLSLAKMQPKMNWHFFSKEIKNNTEGYVAQAYIGKEYHGSIFMISKDGRIMNQK